MTALPNTPFAIVAGQPIINSAVMCKTDSSYTTSLTQNVYKIITPWLDTPATNNMSVDLTDGYITVINSGWYCIIISLSFTAPTTTQIEGCLFVNGKQDSHKALVTVYGGFSGAANDEFTISGMNWYNPGDVLGLGIQQTNNVEPVTFGVTQCNFTVFQVGI